MRYLVPHHLVAVPHSLQFISCSFYNNQWTTIWLNKSIYPRTQQFRLFLHQTFMFNTYQTLRYILCYWKWEMITLEVLLLWSNLVEIVLILQKLILFLLSILKNKTNVTINAYIGLFLCSAHLHTNYIRQKMVGIILINFPQDLWKFDEYIKYQILEFLENPIKPENLPNHIAISGMSKYLNVFIN